MAFVDFSQTNRIQRICLNGHIISNYVTDRSVEPYCEKCGAKTIAACPLCQGPLKGGHVTGGGPKLNIPAAYCLHCGKPYPWTDARSKAMEELARESTLSTEDRATLSEILPVLTAHSDTPRTELAVFKMKKLLNKGGPAFAASMRRLFVDIVSETVKKALLEP
jgi:hypothetical protein